jgi:hypothetical protein
MGQNQLFQFLKTSVQKAHILNAYPLVLSFKKKNLSNTNHMWLNSCMQLLLHSNLKIAKLRNLSITINVQTCTIDKQQHLKGKQWKHSKLKI